MINKESPIFVHLKKRKRLKRHTNNNPMRKLLLSAALLAALFMSGCRPSGDRAGAEPSAVADELADPDFHDHHDHFDNANPNAEYKTCLAHAEKIGLGTRNYLKVKL